MSVLRTLLLTTFLLIGCAAQPDPIVIDKKHCIPNAAPGYCTWCAIETVGRHLGIEQLYGLKESKHGALPTFFRFDDGTSFTLPGHSGHPWVNDAALKRLGVKFEWQDRGNYSTKLLEQGRPAIVCWTQPDALHSYHAIIVTQFAKDKVLYLDSNKPPGEVWYVSRDLFHKKWNGYVLVIEKGP